MTRYVTKVTDSMYWRYKKETTPVDEFAHLNGEVKTTKLPFHLKCSRCAYTAKDKQDFDRHYLEEHR